MKARRPFRWTEFLCFFIQGQIHREQRYANFQPKISAQSKDSKLGTTVKVIRDYFQQFSAHCRLDGERKPNT